MMRVYLNQDGTINAIGNIPSYPYPAQEFIVNSGHLNWRCNDLNSMEDPESWEEFEPQPDPIEKTRRDIDFGNSLLLEFLAGQKDIPLDNATYRAVSETFKYAEAALRRGDITQARTELLNIELMHPVWTEDIKNYFIQKIDNYLGI